MGVTGAADTDAAHEVEKAVAVHVPDFGAAPLGDDERVIAWIGGRRDRAVARDERLGLGAGQRHVNVR